MSPVGKSRRLALERLEGSEKGTASGAIVDYRERSNWELSRTDARSAWVQNDFVHMAKEGNSNVYAGAVDHEV
jgi:hypothetical protein